MGVRNYLVEGASGTGKTTVCDELHRRGYYAVHGDRELAYVGDPATGEPVEVPIGLDEAERAQFDHEHHLWDVERVRALIAARDEPATFLCGGSRNVDSFVDLFDGVFVLEIDRETSDRRLAARAEDDWGGRPAERDLVRRLHATQDGVPSTGIRIDATAALADVVDDILRHCGLERVRPGP